MNDAWVEILSSDGTVLAKENLGIMKNVVEKTVDFGPKVILGKSVRISKMGDILSLVEVEVSNHNALSGLVCKKVCGTITQNNSLDYSLNLPCN